MKILIPMILSGFSLIIPVAIVIALQIHLSKMKENWIGLLLPVVTGIIASFLLYLSLVSGFSDSLSRLLLYIIVFYFPTFILLFIYIKINKDKSVQCEMSNN